MSLYQKYRPQTLDDIHGNEEIMEQHLCACGCGEYTNPGRKYISSHNLRNHKGNNREYKSLTKEHKRKISIYQKGRVKPDGFGLKVSQGLKGKHKSQEHKKNLSIAKTGIKPNLTDEQRKQQSEQRKGKKNPFYRKTHSEKVKEHLRQLQLGKSLSENTKRKIAESSKGRQFCEEARLKISLSKIGSNNPNYGKTYTKEEKQRFGSPGSKHPNWQEGISFEPYSPEWTEELKDKIKQRDNYECQNPDCHGTSIILTVHHIDYNKKNCNIQNLITLCISCNAKANYNRNKHKQKYQSIIDEKGN